MSKKKGVVVTSTIELDDETYEKVVDAVYDRFINSWVPIESEDDLPDEDGYYLVTARDEWGDSVYKIAWFTLQNPLVCPSPRGFWSNETGKYKNLAWSTLPPLYEEDEE